LTPRKKDVDARDKRDKRDKRRHDGKESIRGARSKVVELAISLP
jgi:hypothetical protein